MKLREPYSLSRKVKAWLSGVQAPAHQVPRKVPRQLSRPRSNTAEQSNTAAPEDTIDSTNTPQPVDKPGQNDWASTVATPSLDLASQLSTPLPVQASVFSPSATDTVDHGLPYSNFNIRHMQLLSHFILETLPSLDDTNTTDSEHVRLLMPTAVSAPYVVYQLLALSAMHMSRTHSADAERHRAEAKTLQTQAVCLFNVPDLVVTAENCVPMVIFSSSLGLHALADATASVDADTRGTLDKLLTYISLHRGVRAIMSQSWQFLKHSSISPMLDRAERSLSAESLSSHEEATAVRNRLCALLNHADMSAVSVSACHEAISQLELVYQTEPVPGGVFPKDQPSGLICDGLARLGSPTIITDDYNSFVAPAILMIDTQPLSVPMLQEQGLPLYTFSPAAIPPSPFAKMQPITVASSACNASSIPYPVVFGAQILGLTATLVQNFTSEVSDQLFYNHPAVSLQRVDYCNVTVTYTHQGQGDEINVETWLPLQEWNGRLQAVGGGGYVAGRFFLSYEAMAGALGEGYVASSTDAGIGSSTQPDPWALNSPGNVDLYALQNMASVSLNDQDIISSFYGQPAEYSYWSGCSQGGRQGFMLAQRYPDAYDGIAASAPAFNWAQMLPSTTWTQVVMETVGHFPSKCEFDALTDAAVASCDALDGVVDGLISDTTRCLFDPFSMVGSTVHCTEFGKTITISNATAAIANATWAGPRDSDGQFLWYGLDYQSQLTSDEVASTTSSGFGWASTACNANGTSCYGIPLGLGEVWLKFFVQKDPQWKYTQIESVDEYARLFHASVQQYDSIIGTSDADLSGYRSTGGKIITYHGLADNIIPSKGTRDYYNRAMSLDPKVNDFFRYFEVPGLAHCSGGTGGQPTDTFRALVDWVEHGVVPESLPIKFNSTAGTQYERILCPYPSMPRLVSEDADATKPESYQCAA
ncbi:feruloyl esterase b precursor [Stemphylium lycopersici]|nr:feruloyl esterase b precursor [Stemphylium lycopersici]